MKPYRFEDDIEKERVKKLTQDEVVKLKLYKLHVEEKRTDPYERMKLILFMANNDLDSSLIKYL